MGNHAENRYNVSDRGVFWEGNYHKFPKDKERQWLYKNTQMVTLKQHPNIHSLFTPMVPLDRVAGASALG